MALRRSFAFWLWLIPIGMDRKAGSSQALAEVLEVLAPHMARVIRVDVTEIRVSVDMLPLRETADGKQVDTKANPDRMTVMREALPGAVFPTGPKR
jgi:hypothetical protein